MPEGSSAQRRTSAEVMAPRRTSGRQAVLSVIQKLQLGMGETGIAVGYEKMRWVTIGSPSQPEVDIVLEPPAANPNMSPDDRSAVADLMAKGVYGRIVFWTDNCDATFDRVQAAGADVVQEPTDQPYGVRDCAFRDPAGNEVRFNQAKR